MRSVGILEAKNQLSALVAEVERGEIITLTRNGKPVAELRPTAQSRSEAIRRLREFRGPRMTLDEIRCSNRRRTALLIVVDASISVSWLFSGEANDEAQRALTALGLDDGRVPAIWPLEVQNALLRYARTGRLAEPEEALERLRALHLVVESPRELDGSIFSLAQRHALSAYDASYLDLALRLGCKLATLDKSLARAAEREGVLIS